MDGQPRNAPESVGVYSNAKEIAKERTDHGQATCTDMKGSLSRFPSKIQSQLSLRKDLKLTPNLWR